MSEYEQEQTTDRVRHGLTAEYAEGKTSPDLRTTGSDVFFRDGNYRPESSKGRELLAHELTHVVQQRGAPAPTRRVARIDRPDGDWHRRRTGPRRMRCPNGHPPVPA